MVVVHVWSQTKTSLELVRWWRCMDADRTGGVVQFPDANGPNPHGIQDCIYVLTQVDKCPMLDSVEVQSF